MDQGITDEVSVAAKARLELANVRHTAAAAELKSVKEELEAIQGEHASLIRERDMAIRRAEEAVSASKDVEKAVENLTLELTIARESLASVQAAQRDAENHRISATLATDQDALHWKKALKQAEQEIQFLKEQILLARGLKSELDTASNLLLGLQGELAAYMEAKLIEESGLAEEGNLKHGVNEDKETHTSTETSTDPFRKELEEVKNHIEREKDEINCLKVTAVSLKAELESETAELASMRQREGMASVVVSSLQAELDRTQSEIKLVGLKENEAREQMVELPKALQQAAKEADLAKSVAKLAREGLQKAKEEADCSKASGSTIQSRLHAALKEIEALKASESLARAAIKALQKSEQIESTGFDDSPSGLTLQLDEYYMLSNKALDAEGSADERVAIAFSQVELVKESELRILKKLEAMNRELAERREAVRVATQKAEKANERKLAAEQELRMWKSEHKQQREARDAARAAANPLKSPPRHVEKHNEPMTSNEGQAADVSIHSSPALKGYVTDEMGNVKFSETRMKKKSLFPRLVMFLARKKAQTLK